jgi:hypothetical chaperone protein
MIVGMDFGTTNSGMAFYDGEHLKFIPLDAANPSASVTRSALYITNDRQVYIGRQAIDTYYQQNLNRSASIERVRVGEITLTFAELPSFVRDVYIDKDVLSPGRLFLSFKTALSSLNYIGTVVGSHFYFLEDIIALYLYITKQRAEEALGTELKRIVLGRPVRFSFNPQDDQLARERLLKAAFRAGYEEVYLQYEPIAAAYHYESTIQQEQNVLIFDFGGGTLDISILRIGDAKTRQVLANGGVPIAGDIFDQQLARAKLPKHFGEGSFYMAGDKRMPVPSSFYEAFSNWQDMLNLQTSAFFERIKKIELTAQRPRQIRMMQHLISSNYALKMYDSIEAAKRGLSDNIQAMIDLRGEHFDVRELVTRTEFERVIRSEIEVIENYLDEILNQAGLKADEIDAVIRTGGSSQIPVFVNLLQRRFGKDKVRAIDIFGSVTSGLGIIAHKLEHNQLDAQVYRRADFPNADRLEGGSNTVPAVDFEVMKKFVALTDTKADDETSSTIILITENGQAAGIRFDADTLPDEGIPLNQLGPGEPRIRWANGAAANKPVVVCTSNYRLLLKTPRELARLLELGIELKDAEGFELDVFGDEYVSGLARWSQARQGTSIALVTTSGYLKRFRSDTFVPRVEMPVPYQIERVKGDPLTLLAADEEYKLVAFTDSGRAVRVPATLIPQEGRLIRVSGDDRVIAAYAVKAHEQFALGAPDGTLEIISNSEIPLTQSLNTTGFKVFEQRTLQSAVPYREQLWLLTNKRLFAYKQNTRLRRGETLISLLSFDE